MSTQTSTLHIPKGIRFSCSECGNCCFQWPVPITEDDFKNISEHARKLNLDVRTLFKVLETKENKLQVFSHSLEKRRDGKCEFLTDENRCNLHNEFGIEAKPSMCRLFPYTFTSTPDGVYCSLSFASTAVLFNEGKLLDSNEDHLKVQYSIFQELFPNLNLDWSSAQVIDTVPIKWKDFKKAEAPLLSELEREVDSGIRVERKIFDLTNKFRALVPPKINLNDMAGFDARPKLVDQVLIKQLIEFYCPSDVFNKKNFDFDARKVVEEILSANNKIELNANGETVTFGKLAKTTIGDLGHEKMDMLRRFYYLRIFSKLYFGPGFNFLSVIPGIHHLILMGLLARFRLKLDLVSGELKKDELHSQNATIRFAEYLRTIERSLTVANFSEETVAMLEVLLASPSRIERLIALAA